jgi:hypothetical protein
MSQQPTKAMRCASPSAATVQSGVVVINATSASRYPASGHTRARRGKSAARPSVSGKRAPSRGNIGGMDGDRERLTEGLHEQAPLAAREALRAVVLCRGSASRLAVDDRHARGRCPPLPTPLAFAQGRVGRSTSSVLCRMSHHASGSTNLNTRRAPARSSRTSRSSIAYPSAATSTSTCSRSARARLRARDRARSSTPSDNNAVCPETGADSASASIAAVEGSADGGVEELAAGIASGGG